MGWSLTLIHSNDSLYVNAALLAAGKALYLANAYEMKCQYVVRMKHLASYFSAHPDADFSEVLASVAKTATLGTAVRSLGGLTPEAAKALDLARIARNFIAHEGAAFGYVFSVSEKQVLEHLGKLQVAVAQLAEGDNIVSRWVYEMDEKEPAPKSISAAYPALVQRWVFDGTGMP